MPTKIISQTTPWRWEVYFRWPSRTPYRERRWSELPSRSAALREGQNREAYLLRIGEEAYLASMARTSEVCSEPPPRIPTLREFGPRWIEGHARALRQKRSGVASKEYILNKHLYTALGDLTLDQITTERVAKLAAGLAKYSRKTLANILATLAKVLRVAVEWDVLPAMPCKIKIPKSSRTPPTFYEQDDMRRLIDEAASIDTRTHVLVLLGLHAGLRRGEILGLEWGDMNLQRRQLVVRRNAISKYVDTPKSGHGRVIDLSSELTAALERHRKVNPSTAGRVMLQDSGKPALARHLYRWIGDAMAKAGIPRKKGAALHVMRHSACSALAAMGAPTIAIQALAGHESSQTTHKYMHLAPGVQAAAVALFDRPSHGTRWTRRREVLAFSTDPGGATGDRILQSTQRQPGDVAALFVQPFDLPKVSLGSVFLSCPRPSSGIRPRRGTDGARRAHPTALRCAGPDDEPLATIGERVQAGGPGDADGERPTNHRVQSAALGGVRAPDTVMPAVGLTRTAPPETEHGDDGDDITWLAMGAPFAPTWTTRMSLLASSALPAAQIESVACDIDALDVPRGGLKLVARLGEDDLPAGIQLDELVRDRVPAVRRHAQGGGALVDQDDVARSVDREVARIADAGGAVVGRRDGRVDPDGLSVRIELGDEHSGLVGGLGTGAEVVAVGKGRQEAAAEHDVAARVRPDAPHEHMGARRSVVPAPHDAALRIELDDHHVLVALGRRGERAERLRERGGETMLPEGSMATAAPTSWRSKPAQTEETLSQPAVQRVPGGVVGNGPEACASTAYPRPVRRRTRSA